IDLVRNYFRAIGVTRQKMERDDLSHTRASGNLAGERRRKMQPLRGNDRVLPGEGRFDEELVGALAQAYGALDVRVMAGDIDDIGDALTARDLQGVFAQVAEGNRVLGVYGNGGIIGIVAPDRALRRIEPRTDGQAELRQAVAPYVHAPTLLQGETEARDSVV